MTQENKDLILKDLCGRLPYGVKVHAKYTDFEETIELDGIFKMIDDDGVVAIEDINNFSSGWIYAQIDDVKPYLFPLSSMTEEQYKEYWELEHSGNIEHLSIPALDWLNAHHFDYRGLIEKGLAYDTTSKNIY